MTVDDGLERRGDVGDGIDVAQLAGRHDGELNQRIYQSCASALE